MVLAPVKEGTPFPGRETVDSPRVAKACGADTLISRHMEAHTMLRAGTTLRFTSNEIEDYRSLGLDFEGARTQDDIEQALATWAGVLADERPDLLDKIVLEMAKATGVKCPARLTRVVSGAPSAGSLRQS
jgi:hypothetical protein